MNTKVFRKLPYMAIAGGALMAAAGGTAVAQEQETQASGGLLEEIVVTARRREESLMDTPVSISAFSGEDMKARQIDAVDQVAQATPGLVFQRQAGNNNHTSRIFIRGIGQADQVPTKQVGVGLYVDGVYVAQNAGSLIDVVDVEAVEVLRGPQGTLFGRNTIGGAIQINTIKPDEEARGEIEFLAGSFDRRRIKAMANVPFTENFFGRFSAITQDKDGYIKTPNATSEGKGGDDIDAVRAAFRFLPTDSLTLDLAVDYSKQSSNGAPSVLGSPVQNSAIPAATPSGYRPSTAAQYNGGPMVFDANGDGELEVVGNAGAGRIGTLTDLNLQPFTSDYYLGDRTYTSLTAEENENTTEVYGVNFTLNWDLSDSVSLKTITSYRDIDVVAFGDFDNSPLKVFHGFDNHEGDAFSQEIQLSGTAFEDRLAWVGGLYYYKEELVNTNFVEFPFFSIVSGADVDNQSQAAFGQFTYDFTDRLHFTFGARYTEEDFDYNLSDDLGYISELVCGPAPGPAFGIMSATCAAAGLNNAPVGIPLPPTFPANGLPNGILALNPGDILVPFAEDRMPLNASETQFEPYINLSYDLTDELMVYGSYSEGFKGGGFTQRLQPGQQVNSFDPEFAEVFEIGAKWQSDNLRVTGAVFYNDYTDLQLLTLEQTGGVTRNAGEALIQGGELEVTYAATQNLNFSLGLAYLDSEYDDLGDGVDIPESAQLPFTSEWQHNAAVSYAIPLPTGELIARLDYFYTDSYFAEAQNLPEHEYGDYRLFNGGLTYLPATEKWEVALGVRNIQDKYYKVAGSQTIGGNGWNQQIVAPPREWSLRYQYNF